MGMQESEWRVVSLKINIQMRVFPTFRNTSSLVEQKRSNEMSVSSKGIFLDKFYKNKSLREKLTNETRADVEDFQKSLIWLIDQVEKWLHDTGLEVKKEGKEFEDISVKALGKCERFQTYTAMHCLVENEKNWFSITPYATFSKTNAKGWAGLKVHNNKSSTDEEYLLRLEDDRSWTFEKVPNEGNTDRTRTTAQHLDEESFFNMIEKLA